MIKQFIFILAFLFLNATNAFSQKDSQFYTSGTYIISAICKDGVVLAVDSKAIINVPGKGDAICGYYDSEPKIYQIRNCIVAFKGPLNLNGVFLAKYITEFRETLYEDMDVSDCIVRFANFIHSKYKDAESDFSNLNILGISNFGNRLRVCHAIAKEYRSIYSDDKGVLSSNKGSHFGFDSLSKYNADYCIKRSCDEIGKLMESEINSYAKRENDLGVGGKIIIAKITKDNKIIWNKNKPNPHRWMTEKDLLKDYKNRKLKIIFTSKECEDIFIETVDNFLLKNY